MAPAARAEPSAAGRYTRERYFRLVAEGVLQPDDGVELLVPGELRDYRRSRPTTALSVVEVSDSSLAQDRITKAAIYAAAASRNTGS